MELIEYQKCSTCKKARNYLEKNKINFVNREIKENTPTEEEINSWINKYNIDINKLFNTSGMIYREMNLKEKIKNMTTEEKIKILSQNAMLIKRPILIDDNQIYIGFKEKEWNHIKIVLEEVDNNGNK